MENFFCEHCGEALETDDLFCPVCGQKVVHIERETLTEPDISDEFETYEESQIQQEPEIPETPPTYQAPKAPEMSQMHQAPQFPEMPEQPGPSFTQQPSGSNPFKQFSSNMNPSEVGRHTSNRGLILGGVIAALILAAIIIGIILFSNIPKKIISPKLIQTAPLSISQIQPL